MQIDIQTPLVGAGELAALFNVSKDHIRQMARERRIPAVKVSPKCWRFDREAVVRAILSGQAIEVEVQA